MSGDGRGGRGPLGDQVFAWAVVTAALGLLPVNAHDWYAIWPLAPVALAWAATVPARRRRPRSAEGTGGPLPATVVPWWLWLFLFWLAGSFLVYHTHPRP